MNEVAIVTGLRGQDASIITGQLIEQGYKVYGLIRRASQGLDLGCAKYLENNPMLEVVEGDLLDLTCLINLCKKARANLFFSLAAQSHVGSSFEQPIYTAQVTGVGVLNCLEAIRQSGIHTRFLQASSSEMFGGLTGEPANETTPFHPRSPYGAAKAYGYWITVNYRESYRLFACNSICFNHEGPGTRGPNFVTRKISLAVARIKAGKQNKLFLGNLDAKRDWGYAPDFTQGMISIINSAHADDFVLATGETHSVREFCEHAFNYVGLDYRDYVEVDPQFYRPAEVNVLIGDYSKAKNILNWKPTVTFRELVERMVEHDLKLEAPRV
jgi:GDPmannose 4,6-dehydratase